jgi:hypothetical protein
MSYLLTGDSTRTEVEFDPGRTRSAIGKSLDVICREAGGGGSGGDRGGDVDGVGKSGSDDLIDGPDWLEKTSPRNDAEGAVDVGAAKAVENMFSNLLPSREMVGEKAEGEVVLSIGDCGALRMNGFVELIVADDAVPSRVGRGRDGWVLRAADSSALALSIWTFSSSSFSACFLVTAVRPVW